MAEFEQPINISEKRKTRNQSYRTSEIYTDGALALTLKSENMPKALFSSPLDIAIKRIVKADHALGLNDVFASTAKKPSLTEIIDSFWQEQREKRILAHPTKPAKELEIAPNLGENPEYKDIGFDLPLEAKRFLTTKNYWELDANIRSWTLEFAKAGSVFPNLIAKKDGFIVNSYDGERVVPKISRKERYGANVDAAIAMEEFFAEPLEKEGVKRKRRMAILNSPAGWNGIVDDYADAQTVIQWEDEDGHLKGVTLRTDLTLEQSLQLSISLGGDKTKLTGNDRRELIASVVRNPVLLEIGSNRFNTPEDIAEQLLQIRGRQDIVIEQLDGPKLVIPVADMIRDIKRRDELLKYSEAVEGHLAGLKAFISDRTHKFYDFSVQNEIAEEIGKTMMRITTAIMVEDGLIEANQNKPSKDNVIYFQNTLNTLMQSVPQEDFSNAKKLLRSRVGCSKGRNRLSVLSSSSGLEIFSDSLFLSSESNGGSKEGSTCKVCHQKAVCGYCESHAFLAV